MTVYSGEAVTVFKLAHDGSDGEGRVRWSWYVFDPTGPGFVHTASSRASEPSSGGRHAPYKVPLWAVTDGDVSVIDKSAAADVFEGWL